VTIAFAIPGPSLPLAGPAGFFGPERVDELLHPRDHSAYFGWKLFISTNLSAADARNPTVRAGIVNNHGLCKQQNFFSAS
jgi:hypothetical protein